jgi:NAD(P)H-binding
LIPGGITSLFKPSWSDPTLCADATRILIQAASELVPTDRPKRIIVISSTGCDEHKRDVPLIFVPFYHYFFDVPHADKRTMERIVRDRPEGVYSEAIILRPSLLTDGGKAEESVRVGEDVMGYTISREDVGIVTFKLCRKEGDQYVGKAICCSYWMGIWCDYCSGFARSFRVNRGLYREGSNTIKLQNRIHWLIPDHVGILIRRHTAVGFHSHQQYALPKPVPHPYQTAS